MTDSAETQLVTAGQQALDAALGFWGQRIVDPPRSTWREPAWDRSREAIDAMIRGKGGLGWTRCSPLVRAYRRDGDYEWCGAFAATCWRAAGLDPAIVSMYWSSTYRLSRYARRKLAFWTPREIALRRRVPGEGRACLVVRPETTLEDVEAWAPRAGDLLMIDSRGLWGYGHHITVFERLDGAIAHTVEGNATGRGPDDTTYQGVVRRTRAMSEWRYFIRPALSDLIGD